MGSYYYIDMERHTKTQFKEIFCASNGYLSSKRVLGALVLVTCLVFIVIQAVREGMTDNIKDLFEILIITSTALLGITSVTNIWKQGKREKTKIEEDI